MPSINDRSGWPTARMTRRTPIAKSPSFITKSVINPPTKPTPQLTTMWPSSVPFSPQQKAVFGNIFGDSTCATEREACAHQGWRRAKVLARYGCNDCVRSSRHMTRSFKVGEKEGRRKKKAEEEHGSEGKEEEDESTFRCSRVICRVSAYVKKVGQASEPREEERRFKVPPCGKCHQQCRQCSKNKSPAKNTSIPGVGKVVRQKGKGKRTKCDWSVKYVIPRRVQIDQVYMVIHLYKGERGALQAKVGGGGGRSKGNAGTTNRRKRTFRHCTHRLFCRNAQTGCQSQNSCTAPVNGTSQLNQSTARHVHGVSGKGKRKREKGRGSQTIIFYKATCLCRRREGGKESPRRHASVTPMRKARLHHAVHL